ncbi:MAG TPA: Na+/H+ antiporter NhaA [Polyangiaceae bacterium]|nr:Na+/H+ antiporter NhaA [Polyangiaceae bacterium]
MPTDREGLPYEFADRFTRPLRRFLKIESAAGVLLLFATVVALVVSNSPLAVSASAFWEQPAGFHFGSLEFTRSVRHWVNDALMTLFFFVVALELKRELVSGSMRRAAFPMAGALGGMIVPPAIYVAMLHGAPGSHAWGTAISTDTAFVLGGLALLGTRVPVSLRLFILSLAVIDDVGAILIVAVVYGGRLSWPALAVAGGVVVLVLVIARAGFRSVPLYVLAGGVLWFSIDASGVHPSIAGVLLGLMTPAREWVSGVSLHRILERVVGSHPTTVHQRDATERDELQTAAIAAREAFSPVERIELRLHPWSAFLVMPVFALANAGVQLSWEKLVHPVSIAVATALVVGKPVGVIALCWLAERARVGTRPADLSWSVIAAASVLTGIGFTMSIFIAGLAFDSATLDAAKVGILSAALFSGSVGLVLLFFLTKRHRHELAVAAEHGPADA